MRAGVVPVSIGVLLPKDTVSWILHDSDVKLVFCEASLRANLPMAPNGTHDAVAEDLQSCRPGVDVDVGCHPQVGAQTGFAEHQLDVRIMRIQLTVSLGSRTPIETGTTPARIDP